MPDPDDTGFIGRWSRRKTEAGTSGGGLKRKAPEIVRGRMITEPLPVAVREDDAEAEIVGVAEPRTGEAIAPDAMATTGVESETEIETGEQTNSASDGVAEDEDLETIDIEGLGYDADFTRFMQPGVPERVRQRALQRLWQTNPILANVDGLNDYDEDFSDAALAVDVMKSAYRVGQGYLSDTEVAERDTERAEEDGVAVADGDTADDADEVEVEVDTSVSNAGDEEVEPRDADAADEDVVALETEAPTPERA